MRMCVVCVFVRGLDFYLENQVIYYLRSICLAKRCMLFQCRRVACHRSGSFVQINSFAAYFLFLFLCPRAFHIPSIEHRRDILALVCRLVYASAHTQAQPRTINESMPSHLCTDLCHLDAHRASIDAYRYILIESDQCCGNDSPRQPAKKTRKSTERTHHHNKSNLKKSKRFGRRRHFAIVLFSDDVLLCHFHRPNRPHYFTVDAVFIFIFLHSESIPKDELLACNSVNCRSEMVCPLPTSFLFTHRLSHVRQSMKHRVAASSKFRLYCCMPCLFILVSFARLIEFIVDYDSSDAWQRQHQQTRKKM